MPLVGIRVGKDVVEQLGDILTVELVDTTLRMISLVRD